MANMNTNMDLDAERTPVVDRMDMEYKLYVDNVPSELDEGAVGHVFERYGEVTGIFHPPNVAWAYITYASYSEAESAIRALNDKKPLYLKVIFAKNRRFSKTEEVPKSRTQKSISEDTLNFQATVDAAESLDVTSANHPALKLNQTLSSIQKHRLSKRLEDARSPLEGYNIYENETPYGQTSRVWSNRSVMINTPDRRRRVSFGRGYTGYEVPEPDPQIEEYIKKVHEQRYRGLYEYSYDRVGGVKRCLVCNNKTVQHCQKCDTYYCSKICQVKDWPRHQTECERVPALVEETTNNMSSLEIAIKDEKDKHENQAKEISRNDILRRPRPPSAENMNMSMNKNSAMNDSINNTNQRRYPSVPYENDVKNTQIKTSDQPVTNIYKDLSSPNQSVQVFDQSNENTSDQMRGNKYTSTPNNTYRNNRTSINDVNKRSSNERPNTNNSTKDKNYNSDKNPSYQRNESQNLRKSALSSDRENNVDGQKKNASSDTLNEDLAFQKDMYLSKTKFAEVEIVVSLDNGEYWVSKTEDTDARLEFMMNLQTVAEKSRNVQPIVGNIYGVMYDTLWHRAMVKLLNPIKVHFIDFGNDEILEKGSDIRDIRDMLIPANFARKIRLTKLASNSYKNLQSGDKISVKMVSINADKTIVVDVQEENSAACVTENVASLKANEKPSIAKQDSAIQLISVLSALDNMLTERALPELEFMGLLQICGIMRRNIYSATFCPFIFSDKLRLISVNLQEECTKMEKENHSVNLKVGDFVCGKTKDGWCRGSLLTPMTSTNLRIALIDEARTLSVEKILPYPSKFLNICYFGVLCEVNQTELKLGETYKFTTILKKENQNQQSLKIDITKNDDTKDCKGGITVLVKPWKPSAKSQYPALSEIKDKSKICLTSYRNHYFMFGRSLDKESIEYYHRILQRVAQAARTAPHLSESEITEKQMVIAPFLDGNDYRALLTDIQGDKAKVVYVDFGNINEVDVKKLQVLPDNFKVEPSAAAKIFLKDVPHDVPMTKEADAYLRLLVAEETPLLCTFDETSKDEVYLSKPDGESVNEKIKQLLQPQWKGENNDDKTCYMLNDVKIANLGKINDTVEALVLHVQEEDKKYLMLAPIDEDLISHITQVLPSQIKEYCDSTDYYIPRAEELCLALYQEAWYRAVCFVPEFEKGVAQIFFIDYGNTELVEHKNIRLMPKDFIEPAAMASICTIVNLAPTDSNGNYSSAVQQVLAELKSMESIVKIKIIDCPECGDYKVELPDIRAKLVEQGLVSS